MKMYSRVSIIVGIVVLRGQDTILFDIRVIKWKFMLNVDSNHQKNLSEGHQRQNAHDLPVSLKERIMSSM
jgi:hypothetical protein